MTSCAAGAEFAILKPFPLTNFDELPKSIFDSKTAPLTVDFDNSTVYIGGWGSKDCLKWESAQEKESGKFVEVVPQLNSLLHFKVKYSTFSKTLSFFVNFDNLRVPSFVDPLYRIPLPGIRE